jgi:SMI1/KNR4 family protein SUKH-1
MPVSSPEGNRELGSRNEAVREKTMSEQDDLKTKIDTLHRKLNEFYELDDSWRQLGEWPENVRGSILQPAASDGEIARAEERFGHEFPPSYKQFLRFHSAWEHFWGDFNLVGTGPSAVQKALDEIAENVEYQTSKLKNKFGDSFSPQSITAWEAEEPRNLYLANHLVIGTNFGGFHWVYDARTRQPNGEMKLVYWNISYGAQDPTFTRFHDFLDWATGEVDFRLEPLKKKSPQAKQKDATREAKAGSTVKPSPRKKT